MSRYTYETLYGFVCADCEPEDDAYFIAVSEKGPCPLDVCPRCDSYLGFVEWSEWEAVHKGLKEFAAHQHQRPAEPNTEDTGKEET